ncbi:MAG: hypothetical protein KGK01_04825 [Bradyrhizobium sp.]|uniref:hypothetical protein n=1 Tax=Bradyrhizobium sp. TaxID=376 RepID=UPI001C29E347|nr:hypothetical protein [Bradyrhizobium sp.]MBU6462766.1 hypothetical protein [Pseudomonadota bacterium]MDE2067665.1 hypothetical protein [Bradyrhizobium sp.]MDE2241780.1 hypothetical protein [Bradyrhizobium sp.]MDE2469995.1 hypothetical protein [Bradyrhizobium sp.]
MAHSDQGIVKNKQAEEQPKDKQRAETVHVTDPDKSVSREATRNPRAGNSNKPTAPHQNG